jgi:capsule polysaccharide export protein KpsE/RkpR
MDDIYEAEEGIRQAQESVREFEEKLQNEEMRLEGFRLSRNYNEEKSADEVSSEKKSETLGTNLAYAQRDLAVAQRQLEFAQDCEQRYHFHD